ncbi:hypothetical protein Dsin_016255 [Dipteronia sinensis]|uniref:MADS-box domain-containing protein n=1 Tax=Dipteronia sinensis TaxID=43782 RepID=A0AAE0E5G4_9ROSI|nr:hypothetical protein Dsin_016255 [Dipteronia sinensis]
MGRGKLILKLIENEKSRMTTYQKRKKGLKKKAKEFATLCGVPTGMIIYGPKLKNLPQEVDVWPKEDSDFMEVVNLYKDQGFCSRGVKADSLFDFFKERKRKVDDKMIKVRRSNLESKFPSFWDDRLNSFSVDQLRVLLVTFDNNIEVARRKIAMIKGDQKILDCPKSEIVSGNYYSSQLGFSPCNHSHQKHIELDHERMMINKQPNISSVKPLDQMPIYHMLPYDLNPNNNQMMIGGDNHLAQFGGVSGGNASAYGQVVLQPTLFLDPPAVIVDNAMINNQRATYFYGTSMQTLQQHYEQQNPLPLPSNNSSQMYGSHHQHFNDFYRDMNEFGIKHERGKL